MRHLDGDTIVEQIQGRHEHFVPLHTTDIVAYLAQHPALDPSREIQFRQLSALILSLLHHLYRQRQEHLTYIYAPLDPDRDRMLLSVPTPDSRDRLCRELVTHMQDVLARANYHLLSPEEIEHAIKVASHWGVRMRVNFDRLSELEVYARGCVIGRREVRRWVNGFRKETVEVPLYQRIVVLFRTKEDHQSSQFDSRRLYLRMFKNVPQQDVDMLLPATGIQMSWLDHSRIVVPSLYAAAVTLWRFLRNVLLLTLFGVFKTVAMVVLILFAMGFGIKSMFTYRSNTKRRYMLNMAQSLYYQNLDNNAGVLLRLLEEGEQQEAGEAILAYFACAFLLPQHAPMKMAEIDEACENLLREATHMEVDFDVEATARNLVQLGILVPEDAGWRPLPLHEAVRCLDKTWDDWFRSGSAT
jgi:hypothetical protein